MFYTQFGQLNVQVPYTVAGNPVTHMQTLYQGATSGSLDLAVVDAAPPFPGGGEPDGLFNSASLPPPGIDSDLLRDW